MNVDARLTELATIIFDRKYIVKIKTIDNLDPEYIREYGRPTTNNPEYDKMLMNELVHVAKTIAEMVVMFKKGVVIRIQTPQECAEIYEVIHEYLQLWQARIQNSINVGVAPMEDLIDMDAFAAKIHAPACEAMTRDKSTSTLMNFLANAGMGRYDGTTEQKDEAPRQHVSLADSFSQAISGWRGSVWK